MALKTSVLHVRQDDNNNLIDAFVLVSEVPVDDVETQSANQKYR